MQAKPDKLEAGNSLDINYEYNYNAAAWGAREILTVRVTRRRVASSLLLSKFLATKDRYNYSTFL